MKKFDVVIALEGLREARVAWAQAKREFDADVDTMMSRLIREAAVNFMSDRDVSKASGYSPKRVRDLMRRAGLNPRDGKRLLSVKAAEALAENSALLGIEPHEMDLMSPLAYLPMGSQLKRELQDKTVSQVHEVSGNVEDTITHIVISNESGTWCREDCPRPEDECGALAVVWNAK